MHGFAAGLSGLGIGKGDVVAVLLPNLPEYPVVFLGTALAGAASTTLNPSYTSHEIETQLVDCGGAGRRHGARAPGRARGRAALAPLIADAAVVASPDPEAGEVPANSDLVERPHPQRGVDGMAAESTDTTPIQGVTDLR